jgi:hypothetical protein
MAWPSDADLADLVSRFTSQTLPKGDWTHRAHLAVGAWHVSEFGPDRALALLRSGIQTLNDSHGTANTDSGGYHETMTRAYVVLIAEVLRRMPTTDADLSGRVRELLASPLAARDALLAYYSKGRLFSVEARREWVEPDLSPLGLERLLGAIAGAAHE